MSNASNVNVSNVNTSNVIGVLSGKGGVGKTTVVANLGVALASEFDKKPLLIDTSVKTSHLGLHFGLYEELPLTLKDVLLKKVPVMHAIFFHPQTGIRLLPAPMKGDVDLQRIDGIIKELNAVYDPILVDCAPGLGRDVVLAAKAIDKALLVTTPDLPALTDALKVANLLKKLKKDIIGIVLNRVKKENYELTVEEVESTCECNVIAVIPETNKIPRSIAEGVPVVMNSNCEAAVEFKRLAAILVGAEYRPSGFWYRLKRIFGVSRRAKSVFIREVDLGKEKLKAKTIEEEQTAVEELREDLEEDMRRKIKKKPTKGVYIADLEKEIMERIKEKLRKKTK